MKKFDLLKPKTNYRNMICKSTQTNEEYNYSFVENGGVLLENQSHTFSIPYEDWVNEYYIVSKLNKLTW